MRLFLDSAGLQIAPDLQRADDTTFDYEGRTVLVIENALAAQMDGKRLALLEGPSGQKQLHLEPS